MIQFVVSTTKWLLVVGDFSNFLFSQVLIPCTTRQCATKEGGLFLLSVRRFQHLMQLAVARYHLYTTYIPLICHLYTTRYSYTTYIPLLYILDAQDWRNVIYLVIKFKLNFKLYRLGHLKTFETKFLFGRYSEGR